MDHDRLMPLAVFTHVFKTEAGGQVEVDLHRGELPEAAQDIDEFDVDLGAVERGLAGNGCVLDALAVERALQPGDGDGPVFVGTRVVGTVVRIPRRKLDLEFVEAEGAQRGFGKVYAGYDFIFNLAGHAEDMGVVLGESAHAQKAVHGS